MCVISDVTRKCFEGVLNLGGYSIEFGRIFT